jgi:hypothetical protein
VDGYGHVFNGVKEKLCCHGREKSGKFCVTATAWWSLVQMPRKLVFGLLEWFRPGWTMRRNTEDLLTWLIRTLHDAPYQAPHTVLF